MAESGGANQRRSPRVIALVALAFVGLVLLVVLGVLGWIFVPTAPQSFEGRWIAEDGTVAVITKTAWEYRTPGGKPLTKSDYSLRGDRTVWLSNERRFDGKKPTADAVDFTYRFSFGNRVASFYWPGHEREALLVLCREGSPERPLLPLLLHLR